MKMLMENWNQFVNEEMSQEGTLAAALEKQGFDAEMAVRLAGELMDEKEIVQIVSKMNEESAKDAGAMTGAGIGSLAYVVSFVQQFCQLFFSLMICNKWYVKDRNVQICSRSNF